MVSEDGAVATLILSRGSKIETINWAFSRLVWMNGFRNKDVDIENGPEDMAGGGESWGEVREWHGHICTTKHKIDSQWEAAT